MTTVHFGTAGKPVDLGPAGVTALGEGTGPLFPKLIEEECQAIMERYDEDFER